MCPKFNVDKLKSEENRISFQTKIEQMLEAEAYRRKLADTAK